MCFQCIGGVQCQMKKVIEILYSSFVTHHTNILKKVELVSQEWVQSSLMSDFTVILQYHYNSTHRDLEYKKHS